MKQYLLITFLISESLTYGMSRLEEYELGNVQLRKQFRSQLTDLN